MKRLAVSVVGGFAIPFLYTIIIGPASLYIKSQTLNRFAQYPVRWPILILLHFASFDSFGSFPFRDQDATIMFVYIVVCDVVLTRSLRTFFYGYSQSETGKGTSHHHQHPTHP